VRPIPAASEKEISTVKAIVDEDAKYTVEEISYISGLRASYVFSFRKGSVLKKPRPY
jgi:hypothetical protein